MKKRIVSAAMALILCLTLLPTAALAAEAEGTEHKHPICGATCPGHTVDGKNVTHESVEWKPINDATGLTNELAGGCYYLTDNVTLSGTWYPKNNITLDLNGKTITANVGFAAIGVTNGVTFTLCDCKGENGVSGQITHAVDKTGSGVNISGGVFHMYGGSITGNTANVGGGVYMYDGTFNLHGGKITGNTAEKSNNNGGNGGGVCMYGGTFEMNGGSIGGTNAGDANTATYGGGVYMGGGTFTMSGGTISGNSGRGVYVESGTFTMSDSASVTGNSGGVNVRTDGNFVMSGGSVANNTVTGDGGGVYVNGTFEMSGGTISENKATGSGSGGGVQVSGTFTMSGGTISENKADVSGGGVIIAVSGATFTMSGNASITNNTANESGGGVYVGGKFTMNGGEITGNTTTGNGGGVYVGSSGTFTVSGAATVMDNKKQVSAGTTANNVYLYDKKTINIGAGSLSGKIGVTTENPAENRIIANNVSTDYSGNFSSDNNKYEVAYNATEKQLVLAVDSGGGTTNPPTTAGHEHFLCGGNTCNVPQGVTHPGCTSTTFKAWNETNKLPTVAGEYYLTNNVTLSSTWKPANGTVLCLNGKTITGPDNGSEEGYVIRIGNQNVTFTLCDCKGGTNEDGKITHAEKANGGGVSVPVGTFNLYGGSITGNTRSDGPGGVYVGVDNPTFNMYGGSITGNTGSYCGGVYVGNGGVFNLYGGEITGNTAQTNGGGVYAYGAFTVSGSATVKDNRANSKTNNVYLSDKKTITIGTGGLSGQIGVTTEKKPEKNKPVTIASIGSNTYLSTHIVSDNNAYKTAVEGNNLVLKVKDTTGGETHTHTYDGTWEKDTTNHWQKCTDPNCTDKTGSVKDKAAHVYDNDTDTICNVCGYVRTVTPSNPGGGTTGGGSTGGTTGGGSSSGSSSSDRDSYDSNPVIKTETKNNADGSTTKTETRRDGSVTQTTTGKDGSVSKTETRKDGSSVTENKAADGSTGTVKTDKNGQTEAKTALSNKAIEDAKKSGEPVKAPVEVEASRNSSTAPTVKVELPKGAGETKVEIPVSNVKPGTVAVLVHADGTEEILKASIPTEDGIQLTVDGSATVKIVDNSKGFIDIRNHWAEDEIDFVSARGLVNGVSDTIYAPNNSTTRAQLWTILARQNDANLNGGNTWYEKAQNWAKSEGVSDGTDPNADINRAQMVTMLWRAVGQPAAGRTASFIDVPADAYYAGAVSWAVENGITVGVGGGRFDPNGTCTRAQIATFLYRLYLSR